MMAVVEVNEYWPSSQSVLEAIKRETSLWTGALYFPPSTYFIRLKTNPEALLVFITFHSGFCFLLAQMNLLVLVGIG